MGEDGAFTFPPHHFLYSFGGHLVHCLCYASLTWFALHSSAPFVLQCGLGVVSIALLVVEIRYMYWRRRLPPGTAGFPLVGHTPYFIQDNLAFNMAQSRKMQNEPRTINVLSRPAVAFTLDEDAQWFLRQERQGKIRAKLLPHWEQMIGTDAIMFQSGRQHQLLRKLFGPAFGPNEILNYVSIMDSVTQSTLEQLSKRGLKGKFCPPREWALLAFRIFFVCAFGEVEEDTLVGLIALFEKWISCMAVICPVAYPGSNLSNGLKYRKELGKVIQDLIDKFRSNHPPGSKEAATSVMGQMVYSTDEAGNYPTPKQLEDNIRFIMFAGFDTTKASFGAVMHYLKHRPELWDLLVQEVQEFAEPLDASELKEAPLLNAVLAETWRLNAPLSSHTTVASVDLTYKGFFIPKGTQLALSLQAYHHTDHPSFPDPLSFRFERWLPPTHPLHDPKLYNPIDYNGMSIGYRPFNVGQHMCLGAHFAKQEVRIVLTRLLQRYDVELRNETLKAFPLRQRLGEFRLTPRKVD